MNTRLLTVFFPVLVIAACTATPLQQASDDDDDGPDATSSTTVTVNGVGSGVGGGATSGVGGASASSATTGPGVGGGSTSASSGVGGSGGSPPPPGSGICGSALAIDNDVFDGCLTDQCCATFDPCNNDPNCSACLADPNGFGCDSNPLYLAFGSCFASQCPAEICGSALGTSSPNLNACIQGNCCVSFNACDADFTCSNCLQFPNDPGCSTNSLHNNYETCRDNACPGTICGAPIIFTTTYYNNSVDVDYGGTKCGGDNCCSEMTACADPSNDGYLAMNDFESDQCLECLNASPLCPGGAVQTAATSFNSCYAANCP